MLLAIMGTIAAIVVPQMSNPGSMQIQAAGRMVMADIIYAQNEAISSQATRRVVFEPAQDRYRLTDDQNVSVNVSWKGSTGGAGNYIVDLQQDARFGGVEMENVDFGGGSDILEFDAVGSAISGGTLDLVYRDIRYRITVSNFTGKVEIEQTAP